MAQSQPSPLTATFLNLLNTPGSLPTGWQLLKIPPGMSEVDSVGFLANAYFNQATGQVIMAFQGIDIKGVLATSGVFSPALSNGAAATDQQILNGITPDGYNAAVSSFVLAVTQAAQSQAGITIDASNTCVTGNSLGVSVTVH